MKIEEIRALSKDVLLALIMEQGLFFYITPRSVISAKIYIEYAKQEALFSQWESFKIPDHGKTIEQYIKYYEARKKREDIWKKYERVGRKIDSLYKELEAARA
jgi:hypothetical protein